MKYTAFHGGRKKMSKLWILTEERPKNSVIYTILEEYCNNYHSSITGTEVAIKPKSFEDGRFAFEYLVEGVVVQGIDEINIKIVSGYSSFMDYMLVKQESAPNNHSLDNILFLLEETKTSDAESRNTGIGQRASKFAYANYYCPDVPKYMLYNEEATSDESRKPSDTNVFGTNMLLAQGVKFIGKSMAAFKAFTSVDELIEFKSNMRLPNKTNVPIRITKINPNTITISGRLSKPKDKGNIGHDPNIGTLTCIASTLRELGWQGDIVITNHGVSQSYATKNKDNKFIRICKLLDIKLEGITLPINIELPEHYWQYAMSSEKVASILLHLACQYKGIHGIYENHAGCERSYFREADGSFTTLHKKDSGGVDNLLLPDVVLRNDNTNEIYLIEGKMYNKLSDGLKEIDTYDAIIKEHISRSYPSYKISRWVTLFGGELGGIPDDKVIIYVDIHGKVFINRNAPKPIKDAFEEVGIH